MHRSQLARVSVALSLIAALAACGGGGSSGGGSSVPLPIPTTTPPPPGATAGAFTCPSSSTSFAATSSANATPAKRAVRVHSGDIVPSLYAVTYSTRDAAARTLDAPTAAQARTVGALSFDALGRSVRVVHIDPLNVANVQAKLRSQPGVTSVSAIHRVFAQRVTHPYFTNDPYFRGSSGTAAPLYETASTPGQWDMHDIGLEYAFAYSQPNNGSGIVNAGALGSTNVRLAMIDTGEDVTHPEISGAHIVRTACFITNSNGTAQSTGSYVTDPDGHGTDVTGIAAAATNNAYGFAGTAGNVSLMLYRVFPTPDSSCADTTTTDPQCSTSTLDIASAINDAVSNGANVINLSLGASKSVCSSGNDPDATEGAAIQNAIAHNVIVVAASGNENTASVDPPGCDSGVLAVGASSYNDGTPNGSQYAGAQREYVASYSNYGTGSWGVVAPGGDPTGGADNDNLHWIENIWTSTPYDASDAGACSTDAFGGANDCRILIAGTSMATPHVAGAVALILSVNGGYQSPGAMKQLLCSTADDIGDAHEGCGRLNVYRAVAKAAGDSNLP